MARKMQDMSDFVFINMANVNLLRFDSYKELVWHGVKVDTLAVLRNLPLHMTSLFPDDVIPKAEEDISHPKSKQTLVDLTKSLTVTTLTIHQPIAHWALATNMETTQQQGSEQMRPRQGLQLFTATDQESQFW